MITACKAYITNNGSATIWDQPQDVVAEKFRAAISLNQVTGFYMIDLLMVMNAIYFFNQCILKLVNSCIYVILKKAFIYLSGMAETFPRDQA